MIVPLKSFLLISFLLLLFAGAYGQTDTTMQKKDTLNGRTYLLQKVNRDGESLPEIEIKEVIVLGRQGKTSKIQYRRYDRLIYNLKRVYPYSIMVREKLGKVNEELSNLNNERDRKKYIKDFEKGIFAEYEDDIRGMTITQGRLLLKLIDRETQNTSYDLIRQYRGGLSAALWQGVARIFGTNLKEQYDPYGNDALIEILVVDIEAGRL